MDLLLIEFFGYFLTFFRSFSYQNRLKIIVGCMILLKKLCVFSVFGIYTNSISKNEYMQFVQNRESIFLPFKSYWKYMFSCVLGNFFRQFVIINEFLAAKCGFSCAIYLKMYRKMNNTLFISFHVSKWLNYTSYSILFILKNELFRRQFFKMNWKTAFFRIIFQLE